MCGLTCNGGGVHALLGGSWDLASTYNWGYNPIYNWGNPYKVIQGVISRVRSPVISI